jgi:hypothetical protein
MHVLKQLAASSKLIYIKEIEHVSVLFLFQQLQEKYTYKSISDKNHGWSQRHPLPFFIVGTGEEIH